MLRPGQALALVVVALLVSGVVMVNSAGLSLRAESGITLESVVLSRSTLYALCAVGALVAGSLVPVRRLEGRGGATVLAWLVAATIVLLVLVQVPGVGHEVNGARRWFKAGPISFQPSEFAKWSMPVVLAWHGARRGRAGMRGFGSGFLPPMVLLGIVCALVAIEDLGTAVLIGCVGLLVVLTAGARVWHAATVIPAGVAGFVAAVLHSPYRIERLLAYVDPYQDPQGIGYHIIQSTAAVAGGGLVGRGLGNGVRKFGYLPEDTTDFIFAIVCEELGVFGAAMILFLYAVFLLAALAVLRRAVTRFERLLVVGVMLTVGLQAVINTAVVVGLAPTKGIALPLVSQGGSGWVLTAFSVGLLIAIDRGARGAGALDEGALGDGAGTGSAGSMGFEGRARTA